ncbi:MAG: hypothetical protein ABIJ96_08680 [Elusimicrobiota bacterium]
MAFSLGIGLTACGGGGSDAEEQYKQEEAKLHEDEAKVDRIKELQKKVADESITAEEQTELDDLYKWLEQEGQDPNAAEKCPDGTPMPEDGKCP